MNVRARNNDPSSLLLDVRNAALLIGCSEKSIRARISRKILPHRKLGKRVLFVREELEQFIRDLPGVTIEEAKSMLGIRRPS
jgi:excisionase family DNA binding protein